MGDDWLNLAVWTPDPGRSRLPVVVWISGGGYLNCDTADRYLTGSAVSEAGAVLVSANYRSGFEGFAHIDGAPEDRALLDQLATLSWVQDNIARFGGDPGNVTVLGQSAGAGSIAALLTMPGATGIFRRAILQSVPQTYFTTSLAAEISAEICDELGRTPSVADLADVALTIWSQRPARCLAAFRSAWTDGAQWRTLARHSLLWSTATFLPRRRGLRSPMALPATSSC